MKKILILGGSPLQVPIIKTAREMGHYVIICDYSQDNPGREYANEYYNVSTIDKEAVLNLAISLQIDGIVCYAADSTAPIAAYVANKLGLPSQPEKSVEILTNKELFRKFLYENDFKVPKAKGYSSYEELMVDFHHFKMPVMIKPVDSSGSKGVSKIDSIEDLEDKVKCALSYSRVKRFIIEEYIDGHHVGGDGFSVDGRLVFRCFVDEHFPSKSSHNPFVPIASTYPCNLTENVLIKIQKEIQKVLDLLNMRTGAYNFDIRIDDKEEIYFIEIAARNGGGELPSIIKYATGFRMNENIIHAALGEECDISTNESKECWSCYYLYSDRNGVFKTVNINNDFKEEHIIECKLLVSSDDSVFALTGAHEIIGRMILRFYNKDEMLYKLENITNWVMLIVEEPVIVIDYKS